MEYVLQTLRNNTTKVRNVKKYLLAALYNAPTTIDNYYIKMVYFINDDIVFKLF